MREILFRGKRQDNGAWVEGAYCQKDCDDTFGEMLDRPSMIAVSGRLQIRAWTDKDGNKRRTAEVVADNVYFGESKKQDTHTGFVPNDSVPAAYSAPTQDFAVLEDDDAKLPF